MRRTIITILGWLWFTGSLFAQEHRSTVALTNSGLIAERTFQIWLDSTWVNLTRNLYDYNSDGLETLVQVQEWSGDHWVKTRRSLSRYDSAGNPIESYSQEWRDGQWKSCCWRTLQEFDELGNLSRSVYQQRWNDEWLTEREDTYERDEAGRITETVTERWIHLEPWERYKSTYERNEEGRQVAIYGQGQVWNGVEWVPQSVDRYDLDTAGNVLERLRQTWNGTGWVNENRLRFEYISTPSQKDPPVARGCNETSEPMTTGYRLSECVYQSWDGSWRNNLRETFEYDHNGDEIFNEAFVHNGSAWESRGRDKSVYDDDRNLVEVEHQQWENGAWIGDTQSLYTYDSSSNLITMLWRSRVGGAWENHDRVLYRYGTETGLAETRPEAPARIIAAYPNPTSGSFTIHYATSSASGIRFRLFDTSGKVSKSLEFPIQSPGNRTLTLDLDGIASGVYFFKIEAGRDVQTGSVFVID